MRFWKHSLVAASIFMSIAATVTYTSCTHDSCKAINCRNGGVCSDESCMCPDGYEGSQCEIRSTQKYVGMYYGQTAVGDLPVVRDSAYVDFYEVDTTNRGLKATIISRYPEEIRGLVLKNEVLVDYPADKTITFKLIGENKIQILVDEVVNGKRLLTNFQGTKN